MFGIVSSKGERNLSQMTTVRTFRSYQNQILTGIVIFKSLSGEVRTYNDIRSQALSFGANLQSQWGWRKGDILLFFAPNDIDVPALFWGCHWAGGVVSPANPTYTADELEYQLSDTGAKALVVHTSLLDVAIAAAKRVDFPVAHMLVVGPDSPEAELQHVESMLGGGASGTTRPKIDSAVDTAFVVYSSGTSGRSKGARITHANLVSEIIIQGQVDGAHISWRHDRFLAFLPTYHIFGMATWNGDNLIYRLANQSMCRTCMFSTFPSFDGNRNNSNGEVLRQFVLAHRPNRINHPYLCCPACCSAPCQRSRSDARTTIVIENGNLGRCTTGTGSGPCCVRSSEDSGASGIWIDRVDSCLPHAGILHHPIRSM